MNLRSAAERLLGTSYGEMPCYRMLEALSPEWPPRSGREVDAEHLQIGDYVAFGEPPLDGDTTVGMYLGSGKVIACTPETGVRLFPWRLIRKMFLWGVRVG